MKLVYKPKPVGAQLAAANPAKAVTSALWSSVVALVRSRQTGIFLIVALIASAFQLASFTQAFYATADDNLFHFIVLGGSQDEMLSLMHSIARGQGRIAQYFQMPLNYLGVWIIDATAYRWVVVVGFALMYAAFLGHIDRLLETRMTPVVGFVAVAGIALVPYHMPPNSWPLLFTVPALVLVMLRWAAFGLSWEYRNQRTKLLLARSATLGLLTNEYFFVLGAILAAIEAFSRFVGRYVANGRSRADAVRAMKRRPWLIVIQPEVVVDACVFVGALAIYLAYRHVYPSEYGGNALAFDVDLASLGLVVVKHATWSFSPVSWSAMLGNVAAPRELVFALTVGGCLGLGVWAFWDKARPACPWLPLLIGIAWAVLTALPVALSKEYQHACLADNWCFHADSRFAYLGICLALCGAAWQVEAMAARTVTLRKWVRGTVGVAVAFLAAGTYLSNQRMLSVMLKQEEPFEVARRYACLVPSPTSFDERLLLRRFDDQIRWHPPTKVAHSRRDYLARYLAFRRGLGCGESHEIHGAVLNPYSASLEEPPGIMFLGWYEAENWGRWSYPDGAILIALSRNEPAPPLLRLRMHAYVPPNQSTKQILVRRNGLELCRLQVGTSPVWVNIPFVGSEAGEKTILLEFAVPGASSPFDVEDAGDHRKLGVGLLSVESRYSARGDGGGDAESVFDCGS